VLADFPRRCRILRYNICENELIAENQQEGFLIYFTFCRSEQCAAPSRGLGFFTLTQRFRAGLTHFAPTALGPLGIEVIRTLSFFEA